MSNETVTRWYLYNMKQSVIDDINLYAAEHKARAGEKISNADVVERAVAALREKEAFKKAWNKQIDARDKTFVGQNFVFTKID